MTIGLYIIMLFVWTCIIYGVTQTIVESTIFKPVRNILRPIAVLHILVTCTICTSFWTGFCMSNILYSPAMALWPHLSDPHFLTGLSLNSIKVGFLDGMLASTLVWFLRIIEFRLADEGNKD